MSSKPIVEISGLYHTYPAGFTALREISIEIREGEFVAIVGQNGAGKTTLIRHLNGLLKPTKGSVLVCDLDVSKASTAQLAQVVSLVFQNPTFQLFAETVNDEISFGLKNLGFSAEEIQKRVDEALNTMRIERYKEEYPRSLSKGDQQKVAIASCLVMNPKVFLLDEPTTGHDYKESILIMDLAKELNDRGVTVIFITHSMHLVAKYARRTIVLCDGQVILDGPTREVLSQPELLRKTYLNPPQISQLGQALSAFGVPKGLLTVDEAIDYFTQRILKS